MYFVKQLSAVALYDPSGYIIRSPLHYMVLVDTLYAPLLHYIVLVVTLYAPRLHYMFLAVTLCTPRVASWSSRLY